MRAWFLSGFNNKKLREQEVPAPTKKFTELVHRVLKLEQQAKKEKDRHKASTSDSSSSVSSNIEKTNPSTSESKEDKKKKKRGSWSKKINEMSKRISEISGLRGASRKAKKWCTKFQSKSHTSDDCIQCNYCKAFGHMWNICKISMQHLKEGKDLAMIAYASMEAVPVGTDQQNTDTASGYKGSTNGYNGRGRDRGRGELKAAGEGVVPALQHAAGTVAEAVVAVGAEEREALRMEEEEACWRVRKGDTLWSLSRRHLGDPALWPFLRRACRKELGCRDSIRQLLPGSHLTHACVVRARRHADRKKSGRWWQRLFWWW
ncbi:hypothetical protein L7F22_053270 [Adiantum nelumboides]|nr:hypothetical protein [Adiantum nelumboides]